MLSRNLSIKATFVFSGILAASLVAPSAIAQVSDHAPSTVPAFTTLSAETLLEVTTEPVLESSTEPVLESIVSSEILDEPVSDELVLDELVLDGPVADSETAMLEILTALDAVSLEETEALTIEVLETGGIEVGETVLDPISTDSSVEILASAEISASVEMPAPVEISLTDTENIGAASLGAASLADLKTASLSPALSSTLSPSPSGLDTSNPTTAIPALTSALNNDNILTRLYAADALWHLTGNLDLVLPTLTAAVSSSDVHARDLAISALAQLGAQALPAAPVLNELVGDSRTRQLAEDTLAVVRSDRRPATVLGIIARESRRMLIPPAIRALSGLWR